MLLTKTVKVKWIQATRKYYLSKGYVFTKWNDEFEVQIEDVPSSSNSVYVQCLCDYCLEDGKETLLTQAYTTYNRTHNGLIKKDCCDNCKHKKVKESNLLKYGVEYITQLEDVRNKIKQTTEERYGVDCVLKIPENHQKALDTIQEKKEQVVEKRKQTSLQNWGVDNPMKSSEVKEKFKDTILTRYGYSSPFQVPEIRNKIKITMTERYNGTNILNSDLMDKVKATNLKKYGVENPFASELVKSKISTSNMNNYGVKWNSQRADVIEKMAQTMFANGTTRTSRQQLYLQSILGGELNYPISYYKLDIVLLEDQIAIEYDGGGHDLSVKLQAMTKDEFKHRDIKKYYSIVNNNYKLIRILSQRDYLPNKDIIIGMLAYAKNYLQSEHHWINFDIDTRTVITSQGTIPYEYGEIRRLN